VVLVLVLLAVLQLVRRRRLILQDAVFAAVAVYGAVTYVRFLFLMAILVMPLLAMDFRNERPKEARDYRFICGLVIVALLGMIARAYPRGTQLQAGLAEYFPETAGPWVRSTAGQSTGGRGNLFSNFNWSGYLEWQAPEVKELIDSRVDIFVHAGVMDDYLRATKVDGTFAVLDKYGIRYVLLPREYPMAYLLSHSTEWKRTYEDGQAVGFERVR
jgi:hypothetical protein